MEKRFDKLGGRNIYTEICVFVSSAFATRRNIRDVRRRSFLSLAAGWRHVFDAGKGSIVLWRFDICLDYPAQIDDDITTDSPASCTIAACFDGNGERVVLTENDGSGSERAVSEADARVPEVCLRLTG